MNPINLDALLQIGSGRTQPILQSLKLTPDTLYQALLHIGSDGVGQLHVVTPQGPLQIQLTPQQTTLLLQSNTSGHSTLPQAQGTQVTLNGQIQGQSQSLSTNAVPGQTSSSPQVLVTSQLLSQIQLQLQLQPNAAGQLLIQSQQVPIQLQLQPSQLLQLLGSLQQQTLTFSVQLQRQQLHLLMTLPNQQQLQIPASFIEGATEWPTLTPKMAQLTLQLIQGQLKISVTMQDAGAGRLLTDAATEPQHSESKHGLGPFSKSASLFADKSVATEKNAANALLSGSGHKTQMLSAAQTNLLLPVLAKALNPEGLSTAHGQVQLGQLQLPLPHKTTALSNWQLQMVPGSGKSATWQLQLSADTNTTQPFKVESTALNRPVQWTSATSATPSASTSKLPIATVDVSQAWRQWLPLQNPVVDPLLELPELPPAVLAILKELKSQTLDSGRPIQQAQLQQQLTAAMQFHPLQQISQTSNSANTLAVALQLLLGRLANQAPTEVKSNTAQRLQNLVAQLDQSQSSQLLKQLAGHATKIQGAQFASAEQAQTPQQNQQLFIQLPIVQQGESRFAELALTEREADGNTGTAKRMQWQLTMKFDLAKAGHLLVQVRLTGSEVSLQFYAEQASVVSNAEQFLPLLKDRLKMQGLEVTEAQCQLGKIPEQLFARSNSLVAVRV
jgi:hypothetical protein